MLQQVVTFLLGTIVFSVLQNVHTGCEAHSSHLFSGGKPAVAYSWPLNLHLVPMLRISRTVLFLPLYALMVWIRITFPPRFITKAFCKHGVAVGLYHVHLSAQYLAPSYRLHWANHSSSVPPNRNTLRRISRVACKFHELVKQAFLRIDLQRRSSRRWVKCLTVKESTMIPLIQYLPFPLGATALSHYSEPITWSSYSRPMSLISTSILISLWSYTEETIACVYCSCMFWYTTVYVIYLAVVG
jgi:hypothetical protein